jgi:hypothetical protein
MYRPPIDPGWGGFGASIAGGVREGVDRFSMGRQQQQEQERYAAELARRKMLDQQAEADRLRTIQLQDAEYGIIDANEAYEEVPAFSPRPQGGPMAALLGGASIPVAAGPVNTNDPARFGGPASAIFGGARESIAAAQPATDRRLREGVVKAGGMYMDPQQSLAYRRAQTTAEAERARENAERQERMQTVQGLVAGLPEDEQARAIAQAIYGVNLPRSRADELAELTEELEIRDRFDARNDERQFRQSTALRAMGGERETPALSHSRTSTAAEGIASGLVFDMLNNPGYPDSIRNQSGQTLQPLVYVRANLRDWARREGIQLTEGEIQAIAMEQLRKGEDQYREMGYIDPKANTRESGRRRRGGGAAGGGARTHATTPAPAVRGGRRGGSTSRVPPRGDGATQQVPDGGRPTTSPIDPALVSAVAERIRRGATPEQLRNAGLSAAEIQAAQREAGRR